MLSLLFACVMVVFVRYNFGVSYSVTLLFHDLLHFTYAHIESTGLFCLCPSFGSREALCVRALGMCMFGEEESTKYCVNDQKFECMWK